MNLDFPSTASTGTIFVGQNGVRYQYDGTKWSASGSASTATGYTGSQGSTGTVGYTGSASTATGYTGSASTGTGYTGSQGSTGTVGYTGSASTATGYTGSQGSTGYTGSSGGAGSATTSTLVNGTYTVSLSTSGSLTLPNTSTISPVAQIGYSYGPYASDIYNNTTGGALNSGRLTLVDVGNLAHNNLFNPPTPIATTTAGTIASNGDFTPGTPTTGTFVRFMAIIVNGAYIGSLAYRDDANPGAGLKIDSFASYTGPVVTLGTLIQGYSGWITRTPKTTTYVRWADGSSSQVTGSSVNQYTDDNTVAGLITTDNVSGKSFPATLYTANYVPGATAIGVNSNNWKFNDNGSLTFPNASIQTKAWAGIPGPYADDAAAAAASVAVGYPYHKTGTSGQVFVRLT